MRQNPAEILIDHALGLRWADVPDAPRDRALSFLYHTLAVGTAGVGAAHADAVLAMAQGWGEGRVAGVLGRPGLRLPAASEYTNGHQIN